MTDLIAGRCLCGRVSFELSSEPRFSGKCYCNDCRKASGTGHIAIMGVAADELAVSGTVKAFTSIGASGRNITRYFCPECGSQVYTSGEAFPGMRMVRAALLDDPAVFNCQMSIYVSRAPDWDQPVPGTVQFEELPPAQS